MVAISQLWINGQRRPSSTGKTFDVLNGHTREVVTKASSASMEDVYEAIEAAYTAQPSWEATPWRTKRDLFIKAAQLIRTPKYAERIIEAVCQETASQTDWATGDARAVSVYLMECCNTVTQLTGETMPSKDTGGTVLIERRAHGAVLAMSPFNSPTALATRSIAIALACGNTVVLKSSEQSPRSLDILVEALHEAGFPKGVLNLIHVSREDVPKTVAEMIGHKLIKHINFTGSDVVGKIIAQEAAKYLKPCVLELGGKAGVIVLNDANIEEATKAILYAALLHSGQICMSTERVIVQRGISESLIQSLKTMAEKIRAGLDPSSKIPPLVSQGSAERIITLLKDSQQRGAEVLVGDLQREGSIVQPHILVDVEPGSLAWDKESFGPMLVVKVVDTEEEAIELVNETEYSLTGAVWTCDVQKGLALARRIRASHVNVNGTSFSAEPGVAIGGFGGATGYGRFDVEHFTQKHVVVITPPDMKYFMVVN
ncbi:hypothetical protein Clacol_007685 [Clathrus columnatus]|uniref:Aldehyde dehydrogenase domain-containing protein n=1 Tax=Clathrus columnatus TaxID=1419009 RepID=A0AAV5ALW3_9AGAM|nr:hypothetical protein Clacol_007685 [Clathrus columnatus]